MAKKPKQAVVKSGSTPSPLSEFEAAAVTGMSPTLLRWMSKHAPKSGVDRKLQVAKRKDDVQFYDPKELEKFNAWLALPWPQPKKGNRPPVPKGIRDEIKAEAHGACAICHGHVDTCEAAHIEPVAKSLNNHPDNLIWLCANHHTAFDKGLFKPNAGDKDFVASHKISLRHYRIAVWRAQTDVLKSVHGLLALCAKMQNDLTAANGPEQIAAVTKLANATLNSLTAGGAKARSKAKATVKKSLGFVTTFKPDPARTAEQLAEVSTFKTAFDAAAGFHKCPLCNGVGRYDHLDCPVCLGDREIREDPDTVDLAPFAIVACPLCEGERLYHAEPCPACGEEGQMQSRYAEQVDVREYEMTGCPLCEGERRHRSNDCPVCRGEGEITRGDAAEFDARDYELISCKLCKGARQHRGRDCPACGGEGELEKRHSAATDYADFNEVDCPLCKGDAVWKHEPCPACIGEGKMERRDRERFDKGDFEDVDCPVCKGAGLVDHNGCAACEGTGTMERRFAERS